MKVETTRFGTVEVREEDIIAFPEGLLGFAAIKRYTLLPNPTGGPLMWLQAIDDPKLAFIVCQPQLFKPDYRVQLKPQELASIELDELADGIVYTVMVVPAGNPKEMTANLQGPLVINAKQKVGKQFVLTNVDYGTKFKVFGG